jgi:hypothetical protein
MARLHARSLLSVAAALAITSSAIAAPSAPAAERGDHDPVTGLTALQRQDMLAAHNRWRSRVGVPALSWSGDLAASAARWAAHLGRGTACEMVHSDNLEIGENIYWASAIQWSDGRTSVQDVAASFVVDVWGRESADYQPATNTCRAGKTCGHYTQIVWKTTREVGCALRVCDAKDQVWVCQYLPTGNYVGVRPY